MNKFYKLDVGFFPQVVNLIFTKKAYQKILHHFEIYLDKEAFETGDAETHVISSPWETLIIVAMPPDATVELVAHEVSHVLDHLGKFIGQDLDHEVRAYLTGSLCQQIWDIKEKLNARETSRSVSDKARKGEEGLMLKMDLDDKWSSGPNSAPPKLPTVRRTKNGKGRDQSEAETSLQPIGTARVSSGSDQE